MPMFFRKVLYGEAVVVDPEWEVEDYAGTAAMPDRRRPALVAILAGLLLREGIPHMLVARCAVAFGGVVVIGLATSDGGSSTTGVVLCVLAACSYSVAVILLAAALGDAARARAAPWALCLLGVAVVRRGA
jgi:drug/metabolite transporter (DMT)-like permease